MQILARKQPIYHFLLLQTLTGHLGKTQKDEIFPNKQKLPERLRIPIFFQGMSQQYHNPNALVAKCHIAV